MKSAALTGIGKIELIDIPQPQATGNQLLVRIKSCSICGSDLHYFRQGKIGEAICKYPHFVGHEPAGIVETAPAGSQFKPGDRVAIEPGLSCGECEHCKSGRLNICPNVKFLASPGIPGGLQEYLAVDETQLAKIPDSMSFDEAAMLEPLGICWHAMVNLARIKPGETVGIFGCGAIGLFALMIAKQQGCGTAFVSDPLDYRLEFAKQHCGADFAVNPNKLDVEKFVQEKTSGRGLDVTVDAAGTQQSVDHTFGTVRIGGRSVMIGIPEVDRLSYDPHVIRRKELTIYQDRRSNQTLEKCVELVETGEFDLKPFITHRFPLDEIQEAFELVEAYRDGVVRGFVNP